MAISRSEVEGFDGTGDFSLWKIWMMAHFGVQGLKEVVLSDDFDMTVYLTKSEEKKPVEGDKAATSVT